MCNCRVKPSQTEEKHFYLTMRTKRDIRHPDKVCLTLTCSRMHFLTETAPALEALRALEQGIGPRPSNIPSRTPDHCWAPRAARPLGQCPLAGIDTPTTSHVATRGHQEQRPPRPNQRPVFPTGDRGHQRSPEWLNWYEAEPFSSFAILAVTPPCSTATLSGCGTCIAVSVTSALLKRKNWALASIITGSFWFRQQIGHLMEIKSSRTKAKTKRGRNKTRETNVYLLWEVDMKTEVVLRQYNSVFIDTELVVSQAPDLRFTRGTGLSDLKMIDGKY